MNYSTGIAIISSRLFQTNLRPAKSKLEGKCNGDGNGEGCKTGRNDCEPIPCPGPAAMAAVAVLDVAETSSIAQGEG